MLFVISNSQDETANFLCDKLKGQLPFVRLDTDFQPEDIEMSLSSGRASLSFKGGHISAHDVSAVWFRRPKALDLGIGNDKGERNHTNLEWAASLENFFSLIPIERWINHPSLNVIASNKINQLQVADRLGFNVPRYLVTNSVEEAKNFLGVTEAQHIVKPLASGYIEREEGNDSLIYTNQVTPQHMEKLNLVRTCPVLFQVKVNKQLDVRITVIDEQMTAVVLEKKVEDSQELDIRRDNMEGMHYRLIELPASVRKGIEHLMSHYRLRFAAIDMAIDFEGNWWFFEVNPNGQWAWLDILGVSEIWRDFSTCFKKEI